MAFTIEYETKFKDVMQCVQGVVPQLGEQERKVADFVLEKGGRCLKQNEGISQFCKELDRFKAACTIAEGIPTRGEVAQQCETLMQRLSDQIALREKLICENRQLCEALRKLLELHKEEK